MPTPDGDLPDRRVSTARGPARLAHAARALEPEQRIAGAAALGLWISMFLPWYSKVVAQFVATKPQSTDYSLSAFGAFSFVEAAVLLVASATLALIFARGERRAFHLPGGDGLVILAGGVWVSVLIFYRMLDKPTTMGNATLTTTVGLQWGIFFAMAAALSLAYAGARVRTAHRPEPALRDDPTVARDVAGAGRPGRRPSSPPGGRASSQGDRSATRRPASGRGPAPRSPTADDPTTLKPRPSGPPRPVIPTTRPIDPQVYPAAGAPFDADADTDAFAPPGSASKPSRPRFPPPPPGPPHTGHADDETLDRRASPYPPADPAARRNPSPGADPAARTNPFPPTDPATRTDPLPPTDDPPTRVNRRVPRFDDLDAEWISTDQLSLEADPPARPAPPDDGR